MSFTKENNSDVLIVSFGPMGKDVAEPHVTRNVAYFDFFNFLQKNFTDVDLHFYADLDQYCYHKGIRGGISTDIDTTIAYLKEKIAKYKKVIFIGECAGGYAAVLFGSILNVDYVLSIYPLTLLTQNKPLYNKKYIDVLPFINKTTKYHIIGVTRPEYIYHRSHYCKRIEISSNVKVEIYNTIDNVPKVMRACNFYEILCKMVSDNSTKQHTDFITND